MPYSVVMPCAGSGSRMHLGYNKLLYKMHNQKTVLENTLDVFLADDRCQEIILAISQDDYPAITQLTADCSRVKRVIGGATRQESVYRGLAAVSQEIVLIHDGARPFLKRQLIDDLLTCLEKHAACLLMVPSKDTIKVVENGIVSHTPDRATMYLAQTPQAFHTDLVREAFQRAMQVGFIGTDDASVVEAMTDVAVHLVMGDYGNIKITTPDDLKVDHFSSK